MRRLTARDASAGWLIGLGRPKKNVPKTPIAIDYVLDIEILEQHEVLARRRQLGGKLKDLEYDEGEVAMALAGLPSVA